MSRSSVLLLFLFFFLIGVTPLFSLESENNRTDRTIAKPTAPELEHNIRKVEREDKTPGEPGFIKDKTSGICPQKRDTPQAPQAFQGMTNPLDPTPDNLRAGELLFKIDAQPTACKVCHGYGGDGMGIIFERLNPKPRNFTCYYTMEDISDGQIFWIIKNGSPGTPMPSFGSLDDQQVWQLVLFIRQFTKK